MDGQVSPEIIAVIDQTGHANELLKRAFTDGEPAARLALLDAILGAVKDSAEKPDSNEAKIDVVDDLLEILERFQ